MTTDPDVQELLGALRRTDAEDRAVLHPSDHIPAPRPVPTQEDRMRDARTDQPRTFATYLDRTERDQLDAKAACAQQERDEALDDRDAYKEARDVLRVQLDQAIAERDAARQLNNQLAETIGRKQDTINAWAAEMGAAGDVLAVVRDAAERIDRALAVYDTTPGETAEREDTPHEDPARLRGQLAEAHADCARYATERDEARRELTTMTEVAQGNKRHVAYLTAVIDAITNVEPHIHNGDVTEATCSPYCPGCRIRTAMNTTIDAPSAALGSPPPRAQEPPTAADLLRQAAAGRREYAKNIPEKAEPLELQAHTLDAAAQVVEGDLAPLYDWLPSWRWTPEMHARLHPEREG